MRKFWILTKLQLLSLFGINKMRHKKDGEEKKKGKRSLRVLLVMVFALLYTSVVYSGLLAAAFEPMGQLPLMLGLMALAVSVMILIFSMFETKGVLYGFGDYDMVMSLPAPKLAVAASRAANMYAYNLVYALLLLLPAGVVYALHAAPSFGYYPALLACIVLLPVVPTLIGAALGTLMTAATARLKKSSVWSTVGQFVLMAALVGVVMWLNSGAVTVDERIVHFGTGALRVYPPAAWAQAAMSGEALPLCWLLLVSAAAAALMTFGLSGVFTGVHRLLTDLPHGKAFAMTGQRRSSRVRALYKREWKRYTASSLYVTNTAFGYVMLLAAGVAAAAVKNETYLAVIRDPSMRPVLRAVPLAMGAVMAMSATTGSAISIEGGQFWIVRTLPVSARELFLSKLLVSVTLAVPATLITGTLLGVGLRLEAALWPWLYITPLVSALFSAVFGLTVNLALPRLDWTNEAEVVKQSAAMAASMFGGLGCVALPTVAVAVTGIFWLLPAFTAALFIAALWIWRGLMKRGEARLTAI